MSPSNWLVLAAGGGSGYLLPALMYSLVFMAPIAGSVPVVVTVWPVAISVTLSVTVVLPFVSGDFTHRTRYLAALTSGKVLTTSSPAGAALPPANRHSIITFVVLAAQLVNWILAWTERGPNRPTWVRLGVLRKHFPFAGPLYLTSAPNPTAADDGSSRVNPLAGLPYATDSCPLVSPLKCTPPFTADQVPDSFRETCEIGRAS